MKMESFPCSKLENDCSNAGLVDKEENVDESPLEENMELLELNDVKINTIATVMVAEKTSADETKPSTTNRRYSLRPQKRLQKTEYSINSTKKGCVFKPRNGCLETIFENPESKNGSLKLLGRPLKRFLSFNEFVSKAKIRNRKLKIKRLSKVKVKKPIKVTWEDVKFKLKCLDDSGDCDEGDWMDISP